MSRIAFISLVMLMALIAPAVTGCDHLTGREPELQFTPPVTADFSEDVSPDHAYSIFAANAGKADFVVMDVRTADEYIAGHIQGAISRDVGSASFHDDIAALDRDRTYLVYCRTGVRSARARDIMLGLGFHYLYNLSGGITAWEDAGYPVVR